MNAHLAVQRGVDEGVVTRRAHGHEVTADLEDVDVPLADDVELWIQVQQQVQHLHSDMEKNLCHWNVYILSIVLF